MQKWEYLVLRRVNLLLLQKTLCTHGTEGWELIAAERLNAVDICCILKRLLSPTKEEIEE